jgi:hypothetical protein
MKKLLVSLFAIALLAGNVAAEKSAEPRNRFYGKVVSVDAAKHALTVHNAKQKVEATFKWDDSTGVMSNKKSIAPSDLKVGQSLIVSYVTQEDVNRATKITVRSPFKKKTAE